MTSHDFRTVDGLLAPALALALAWSSAWSLDAGAQPAAASPVPLPDWAVLVLQPVGDKRVRPVTGVVVSAEGAVVVPAAFAGEGDVLIVLDGGSDVIEHGRAATVRAHDPGAGVAVLDVRGLARPPAPLAAEPPRPGDTLRLAAFPPAEQIAEGAAPLSVTVQAEELLDSEPGPLPNVSGPLLDRCGHLAGYGTADGLPAMQPSAGTAYTWSRTLASVLGAAGVAVATMTCGVTPEAVPPAGAQQEAAPADPAPAGAGADTGPAGDTGGPAPALRETGAGGERLRQLGWIGAVAGLALVAFAAWRFGRRRRSGGPGLLQDTVVRRPAKPGRGATAGASPREASGWMLELSGQLASGASFTRSCPVNPAAVDVVIGSGGGETTTDIVIEAPGIAREHVRLGGSAGALTISDLGGAGGTWIGRVPCLRGEVMFLADGETAALGETSFRVRLVPPGQFRDQDHDRSGVQSRGG